MAAGVFTERGGHLQRTFAGAGMRHVAAEGHHFAVLVADFAPAFADLFDVAGLEILREQHARVPPNAGVARILCGDAFGLLERRCRTPLKPPLTRPSGTLSPVDGGEGR